MGPSIILDDTSRDIVYYGTPDHWIVEANQDSLFNRSRTTCVAQVPGRAIPPSFRFTFTGQGFSLWGPTTTQIPFNYTIDGSSVRTATVDASAGASPSRTSGVRLWALENIVPLGGSDRHTIEITPLSGRFIVDYILINPSSRYWSAFDGQNLILDDRDSMFKYRGEWTTSSGLGNPSWTTVPFNGTYTATKSPNATMSLFFEGSSISVYGLLNQQPGVLSASFYVDWASTKKYKPFDGSQTVNASSWKFNELFFHQELSPGQHTLQIYVDEISENQTFYIDSVVFQGTSKTTSTTPISKPAPSISYTSSSHHDHTSDMYAAIGAVVFLLIVFFVFLAIVCCCRKKRRADQAGAENGLLGYYTDAVQEPAYDPVPPYPYPVPTTPPPLPGRQSSTVDRDRWFRFVRDGFNTTTFPGRTTQSPPLAQSGSGGSEQPPRREADFTTAASYQALRSETLNPPQTNAAPSSRIRTSGPPPIYSTDLVTSMPAVLPVQVDQVQMVQYAPQSSVPQTVRATASAVLHPAADNPRPAEVQPRS